MRRNRFALRDAFGVVLAATLAQAAMAQTSTAAAADPARVRVSEFVVTGNTLLPQSSIDAALAPFKGERSLDELKAAAQAVQALYRDAGYGAVIAYVPPQTGAPGQATIAVLEGRIARVTVTGNSRFSDANIRRSVPGVKEGVTPQARRIDAQIQLANENPAKQLGLALEAGEKPGEVDARLIVREFPVSRWTLALDNTGSGNAGQWRTTAGYQNAALWGLDHVLSLQYQTAPSDVESVAVVSASYRAPFYEQGATLELIAAYSDVDGGTTTTLAGPLQFSGRGEVFGARVNKLLDRWGETDQRVSLGLDRRAYLNNCTIVGLPPGACGTSGASVTVYPLTLEYSAQTGGERPSAFSVGVAHNLGIGGGNGDPANFEASRTGAKRSYTLLRSAGQMAFALPRQWQLQLRYGAQWTADALVPGEQFGIAGASTVRGYEEREVTGDSGLTASVEALSPSLLPAADGAQATLRAAAFVDAGRVWNRLGTPCRDNSDDCTLGSLGVGMRFGTGAWQGRLDLARALEPGNRTARGDTRAHVQLVYRFP